MNTRSRFGFAKITDPEWGYLDVSDILRGQTQTESVYKDELPCTFKQLAQRHPEICHYFVG